MQEPGTPGMPGGGILPARLRRLVGTPAAVHTPEPLATFSGSHILTSFYALKLPGQDWACVSCLGMCLAEEGPVAENWRDSTGDQETARRRFVCKREALAP